MDEILDKLMEFLLRNQKNGAVSSALRMPEKPDSKMKLKCYYHDIFGRYPKDDSRQYKAFVIICKSFFTHKDHKSGFTLGKVFSIIKHAKQETNDGGYDKYDSATDKRAQSLYKCLKTKSINYITSNILLYLVRMAKKQELPIDYRNMAKTLLLSDHEGFLRDFLKKQEVA